MNPINPTISGGISAITAGVADMEIDKQPEPVTVETVLQTLKAFQDEIARSFGNLARVESLAEKALRFLHEEGRIAAEKEPRYTAYIEHFKFMVDFDLADGWVFQRLNIPSSQPYTQEQKGEMVRIYQHLVRSEKYLPGAFPTVKEDLSLLSAWNFNILWVHFLKSFCLIGMNAQPLAADQRCSSCQGSITLVWLMQNFDLVLRNSLDPGCEKLIAHVRQHLSALFHRAISQVHQGPCLEGSF
jgi:hypothetical protein